MLFSPGMSAFLPSKNINQCIIGVIVLIVFYPKESVEKTPSFNALKYLSFQRFPKDKYAHIKSRVNSFENFDYHSRKLNMPPSRKVRARTEPNQAKRNTPRANPMPKVSLQDTIRSSSIRVYQAPSSSLISGRLQASTDGRTKIFHEKLRWNAPSKLRAYSLENLHYKSRQPTVQVNLTPSVSLNRFSNVCRAPIGKTDGTVNLESQNFVKILHVLQLSCP